MGNMKILITGAAGFVGQLLAETLLNDNEGRYQIILTDIVEPPLPAETLWPRNASCLKADLLKDSETVVSKDLDAVFVFHGIMSSASEADFDCGLKVNFDATRTLLDVLRDTCPGVRVIYASSQAVYGGDLVEPVHEGVRPTPQSAYGCAKMMCEYLLNEYHRRGFLNIFILRLPTISIRPGKPTGAASSFLSGMIREPMQGRKCVIPLKDRNYQHWLSSPRVLITNLMHSLDLPRDSLPDYDRCVNLPGMGVTVQGMMDSLARVGGQDKLQYLSEEDTPALKTILYSWPTMFDNTKGLTLGFSRDVLFDDIIRDFEARMSSNI